MHRVTDEWHVSGQPEGGELFHISVLFINCILFLVPEIHSLRPNSEKFVVYCVEHHWCSTCAKFYKNWFTCKTIKFSLWQTLWL